MEFHCRPEAARRSTRRPSGRISERVRDTAVKLERRQARGGARGMPGERKYETSTLSLRAQTVETYAKAEVTITTSRMGRPTIPDVRKVTTSSKSALSYRPVTQVGSGGLAQAIGAKAIVRGTRIHATQCRRFIGHESGTPTRGSVSNLPAFVPGRLRSGSRTKPTARPLWTFAQREAARQLLTAATPSGHDTCHLWVPHTPV